MPLHAFTTDQRSLVRTIRVYTDLITGGYGSRFIIHHLQVAEYAVAPGSVENPFFAPLPEEGLHPLHPGRRGPHLAVPLELVHVLPEHVPGPQSADQVVKLSLILAFPVNTEDQCLNYLFCRGSADLLIYMQRICGSTRIYICIWTQSVDLRV